MKKKLFAILVATVIATSVFSACKKNPVEPVSEVIVEGEYVYEDEYVKVANYKNLPYNDYNRTVTKEDVDEAINNLLIYVGPGLLEEDATAEEAAEDAEAEAKDKDEKDTKVEIVNTTTLTYEDLTDELASKLSNGQCTTVEAYRDYVKGIIEESREASFVRAVKAELYTQVLDNSILVTCPEESVKKYIDYGNEYFNELAENSGMSLEEYVKATPYDYDENDNPVYFADMNEFDEYVKNAAKDSVKSEKLIYAIAKNENINVTDEEVEAEINDNYINNTSFSGRFKTKEDVLGYITEDEIKTNILYRKVVDFIYDNAEMLPYEETAETTETVETVETVSEDVTE